MNSNLSVWANLKADGLTHKSIEELEEDWQDFNDFCDNHNQQESNLTLVDEGQEVSTSPLFPPASLEMRMWLQRVCPGNYN